MTLPTYGGMTTRSIAEQLYNDPNQTITVPSGDTRRLTKKSSISIPADFHGLGWGQQMNDIQPNAYNYGNSSNMKPHLMDRRSDGNTNQQYTNVTLDSSKTYYGGVYMNNRISNGSPRDVGWNGYYVVRAPNQAGQFNLNAKVDYEFTWQFGPQGGRVSMNLFGFSAGYLSGNRITFASRAADRNGSGTFSLYNYFDSSYPHICVNLSLWQAGEGTTYARMWDGWSN